MNPNITIIGRVGITPEIIGSGIRFRVVTSDRVKNDNGEWEDRRTSWWTVKAWKSLAEQAKILKKGQEVCITGTIFEEHWTDSSGNNRTSYEIIADNIAISTFSITKELNSQNKSEDPWK